ncbi:hypothetical protein [Hymenobacter fodinae]|uniref:Tail fiber protein n=1 Tax=Hymenobacter fodinae TaxID=2510796 RepID=A0A4Z0P113_9BACT|nr:hypothetical protein [Hymenobacter fodinae]TGE04621.1 hypothetical protein EU556_20770 [Hymenobacter fodinae]
MTLKILDRAFETTQSTGPGPIILQGAQAGFQSFALAGNGGKVLYQINDGDASGLVQNWEVGIGTVAVAGSNTLSRDAVLASSNGNAAVNFGSGVKNVIGSIPASALVTRDEKLNFMEGFGVGAGTVNVHTVTLPTAPLGYSDGMTIYYFAPYTTTGNMSINVNGLGAKSARMNGVQVPPGAVAVGSIVRAVYKESTGQFEITSSSYTAANLALAATAVQPGQANSAPLLHMQDQKTSGTNGGTFSSGSDQTRTLNTIITNSISGASLAGNQITLPAGTYDVRGLVPAFRVDAHRAKLYNVTDGADVLVGQAAYSGAASGYATSNSNVNGRFTINAQKVFEIRHRCSGGQINIGYGIAGAFGTEVYTDVEIRKVA